MEVTVVLAFNFYITVHLKPRWNQSNPFFKSSRSNTITNSFNDNHKNDNDNDYNPCCRSSRPSTMGKPVGLTPT